MSQAHRLDFEQEQGRYPRMSLRRALYYAFKMPRHSMGTIIYGEPGIGKSTLVLKKAYEEARELGKTVIDTSLLASVEKEKIESLIKEVRRNPERYYVVSFIKLGSALPDDIMPTPHIWEVRDEERKTSSQVEIPVFKLSLQLLTVPGVFGCLILDDVTNIADPYKKDFVAGLFGERKLGGTSGVALSKNVRIIGTGNLPEHSELAHPMPEIMVGRAWQVVVEPDDLDTWYQVMKTEFGDAFDDDVYVFLKRYPNYAQNLKLLRESPRVGPVLRSWTALSLMLKQFREDVERAFADGRHEEVLALFAGEVGLEAARQFMAFLAKRVPSVEEVLADPTKISTVIARDLDVAFRFVMQVAQRLEKTLKEQRRGTSEQNTVKVSLEGGKQHAVSLDDPHVYLVLLTDVMRETTTDIASFALTCMDSQTVKLFKRLVRTAVMLPEGKGGTPLDAWNARVKRAGEMFRKFLVDSGITDILLEVSS